MSSSDVSAAVPANIETRSVDIISQKVRVARMLEDDLID